ncbi:hypothetical protein ACFL2V_09335 [Pseudomonadota bacterium]
MLLKIAKFFIKNFAGDVKMPEGMDKILKDENNNMMPDILEDGNLEKHIKQIKIGEKTLSSWAGVPDEQRNPTNLEPLSNGIPPAKTPDQPPGPDLPNSINNNSRLFVLIPIIIVVGIIIFYTSQ